jgi:hypothetical protein
MLMMTMLDRAPLHLPNGPPPTLHMCQLLMRLHCICASYSHNNNNNNANNNPQQQQQQCHNNNNNNTYNNVYPKELHTTTYVPALKLHLSHNYVIINHAIAERRISMDVSSISHDHGQLMCLSPTTEYQHYNYVPMYIYTAITASAFHRFYVHTLQ